MELKTAEEMLDEIIGFKTKSDLLKEAVLTTIRSYASQAVRMALEEAASKAVWEYGPIISSHSKNCVQRSILSLADEIIGKLK